MNGKIEKIMYFQKQGGYLPIVCVVQHEMGGGCEVLNNDFFTHKAVHRRRLPLFKMVEEIE